ncbi:MAG: hypothetical protein D9V46_00265 [Deltaproteobacteria bacterium]|uniref:hypothetical protein n=1 Tax=Hydrosulfovibrio ferrireducens TaxID=2934181 RepID=UPI001223904B|nr:MAG: hypothetical protein D9V46_00265 [Deltaproteobacteria bacterium]
MENRVVCLDGIRTVSKQSLKKKEKSKKNVTLLLQLPELKGAQGEFPGREATRRKAQRSISGSIIDAEIVAAGRRYRFCRRMAAMIVVRCVMPVRIGGEKSDPAGG